MKPACGVKTINGVILTFSLMTIGVYLFVMLHFVGVIHCSSSDDDCSSELILFTSVSVGCFMFLCLIYGTVKLIAGIPEYRRCCFSGRSSKLLREILLSVDNKILTEEQFQEFKEKALLYLNDIKTQLEQIMTRTTFQIIFSGSAVEKFGIPVMTSDNKTHWKNWSPLYTDLDVMFCPLAVQASWSGFGNILIESLSTESAECTGYVNLKCNQGMCISSRLIREYVEEALLRTRVTNLPGTPCCCGKIELTEGIKIESKGPAIKLRIGTLFETDITFCIQCPEWPTESDWASRPRYWPSVVEAQRIMSFGCHLVAKPAPTDKEKTSWRLSFSLAEVELSKLIPETARKCFLALKIIFTEHLQVRVPVGRGLTSYHIKTIFFNTLEKFPVGFWVENNMEECFLTLLAEVRDALMSMNCPHHWFSFVNLFNIEAEELQRLAKKVQRIMQDPAPFILDDGCCCCCCCCCCVRVPHSGFTPRSSEEFCCEYDEVMLSAEGQVIADPGNHSHVLPVSQSPSSEDLLDAFLHLSGIQIQDATLGPEQLVVSLPPFQNVSQEPIFYADEVESGSLGDPLTLVVNLPPEQDA